MACLGFSIRSSGKSITFLLHLCQFLVYAILNHLQNFWAKKVTYCLSFLPQIISADMNNNLKRKGNAGKTSPNPNPKILIMQRIWVSCKIVHCKKVEPKLSQTLDCVLLYSQRLSYPALMLRPALFGRKLVCGVGAQWTSGRGRTNH